MRTASIVVGALLVLSAAFGAGVAPAAAGPSASAGAVDQADCSFPYSATDVTGSEVTVDEEPQRIVTLAPSAAQTLWEFNASDTVVGVSDNAAYLDGAGEKEVVTDGKTVKTEVIVGLEPDLVLAPNVTNVEDVEALRDNGLTVYHFENADNVSELYDKVELTGELAGECEEATATVTDMRERVTAIEEAVSDEEKPGALYSFFGYAAGANTFIDSIITTSGTTNVAAEVGIEGYKPLNEEVVANNSENIEWLILNSNPASHPSSDVYNETTAVRENQTVVVNEDYLNQPAPRTVLALENITRAIHPEAYEEAQAALEDTPTETATDSPTETMTDEPAEAAATTGDGPGFTAVAGLVALLAAVVLFRRR